jgi:hypothetical protein
MFGGDDRIRTGDKGFADPRLNHLATSPKLPGLRPLPEQEFGHDPCRNSRYSGKGSGLEGTTNEQGSSRGGSNGAASTSLLFGWLEDVLVVLTLCHRDRCHRAFPVNMPLCAYHARHIPTEMDGRRTRGGNNDVSSPHGASRQIARSVWRRPKSIKHRRCRVPARKHCERCASRWAVGLGWASPVPARVGSRRALRQTRGLLFDHERRSYDGRAIARLRRRSRGRSHCRRGGW